VHQLQRLSLPMLWIPCVEKALHLHHRRRLLCGKDTHWRGARLVVKQRLQRRRRTRTRAPWLCGTSCKRATAIIPQKSGSWAVVMPEICSCCDARPALRCKALAQASSPFWLVKSWCWFEWLLVLDAVRGLEPGWGRARRVSFQTPF
jgi:hypothetical protein